MTDLTRGSEVLALLRRLYTLLLAVGFLGLAGFMMADLEAIALQGPVLAAATASTGLSPLTSGTAMDGFGSWSPDGKQVAFMRNGRIWVQAADGKEARRLTDGVAHWDATPTWRLDGRQIAFVRLPLKGKQAQVMLLTLSSLALKVVATEEEPVGQVAWIPGQDALLYATATRLVRVDLSTGKSATLMTLAADWELQSGGLAISNDSKQLILGLGLRQGGGLTYNLWRVNVSRGAAGEPQRLTQSGGIMPAFSPDGGHVVYRNPTHESGIYIMNLSTHQTTLIVKDESKALYFHPSISPDGSKLLLSRLTLADGPAGDGRPQFTSNLYVHRLGRAGGN